ncbi:MAG: HEAT repeat domain-containing protein [Simkaniaceae bacterium]
MKLICFFLIFFVAAFGSEEGVIKRIHAHLLVKDYYAAQNACEEALTLYPESKGVKKVYVQALAQNGKDEEAIQFWKKSGLKGDLEDPELLETLAWGVLTRSENSSQFVVNMASLMSAFFTDDVRAVRMLLSQLNSTNAIMRAMAAQLSPHYRDVTLIEELKRLLKEEKIWFVRLEVIQALGAMEVKDIKEPLAKIICHARSTAEEKAAAIASLVTIYEDIDDKEFTELLGSKRAGLRHLACQIVSHLDLCEKKEAMVHLLEDASPDVRIAALNTLYFLGIKNLEPLQLSKLIDLTADPHPPVALTAACIVSRFAPETALQVLRRSIYSNDDASRRLAAFILGRVGSVGFSLAREVMKITPDPYVKANLALGMIGQGGDLSYAADVLYTFLMLRKGKIMWDTSANSLFEILAPSRVCHIPQVPQYPTMVDHLTRLDILGKLAILSHPHAEEAVKSFLKEHALGVTFTASTTLLEEGEEEAIDILRDLLQEEDENVRVQAALVLALSGGETGAIEVLQEAYKTMDRDMKVNILGALGHIGDKASIPFLVELLEEPYQTLKIVAASALIQCVYH